MQMKVDANLMAPEPSVAGELAAEAEQMGFDGVWVSEETHSPLTVMPLVADATERIDVGTSIALAFPRSPMVVAYSAWDLQSLSAGRFTLGLGTQVKGHIERRFDSPWDVPGPRFRDYVRVLQHIWGAWTDGTDVDYHGEYYDIDYCPPDWRPEPIAEPDVPIFVAGVNGFNIQLAGHLGDGLILHPLHSPEYITEEVVPYLEKGAARADRDPEEVTVLASTFVITGDTEGKRAKSREAVRSKIAFYGSTRTYKTIFDVHGWGDTCEELHELSMEGRWDEMPELVSDEMLAAFAIESPWEDIRDRLEERYSRVDRVTLNTQFRGEDHWQELL